jgi:hypothetical protein
MILRLILAGLIAAFSDSGFAQAPATSLKPAQQSYASAPKQEVEPNIHVAANKPSFTCMIFALDSSWFGINIHLFSTSLSGCSEKSFAAVTNDSVRAQLMSLYPDAGFHVHGPYFQMADLDFSSASESYVSVGKLKFSLIGEAKLNVLGVLKDPSIYQKIRKGNFTYLPFKVNGTVNLLWFEGANLYELIAPDGIRYTMIHGSHNLRNEKFRINLNNLGNLLNLPNGWRFEKRISDKIFRVFSRRLGGQEQSLLTDELGNIYIHNHDNSSEDISK